MAKQADESLKENGRYKSRKAASLKYDRESVDAVRLRLPLGMKDVAKERAAELGKSLNAYITDLIAMDIEVSKK